MSRILVSLNMPVPKFDEAAVLRAQADELLQRAGRVKTVAGRKQLEVWAQELREKADQIDHERAAQVTKH
jgi:predicted nucleic acid-binding Zn ribbon protein